jgi:cysteinyl-tRNA synthetase
MLNGNEKDKEIFISACNFIGLLIESKEDWVHYRIQCTKIESKLIDERIKLMDKARENKDYGESDRIRKELQDIGIVLENRDGKTIWKLK